MHVLANRFREPKEFELMQPIISSELLGQLSMALIVINSGSVEGIIIPQKQYRLFSLKTLGVPSHNSEVSRASSSQVYITEQSRTEPNNLQLIANCSHQ